MRGRGIGQAVKLCAVLCVHIEQLVLQHALDAMVRTVDLGDAVGVKRGTDDAVCGSVDDGRGAAGLTDDQSALQRFGHSKLPPCE